MKQEIKERIEKIRNGEVPEGYKETKWAIIPNSWNIKKANSIFKNISFKKKGQNLEVLSVTQDRGLIPRSEIGFEMKFNLDNLDSYKIVEKGDFVISLRSFQGGIEYSTRKGIVSPAYTILRKNENICDGFYKFLLKSDRFILKMNSIIYGIRDGKQIGYKDFGILYLPQPPIEEQNKIFEILENIKKNINLKKELHYKKIEFKKGFLQKLFQKKIIFKGLEAEWIDIKLSAVLSEHGTKNTSNEEVYSVSVSKGLINQKEHLGRSYSASDTTNYKLVKPGDLVYTKSPTGGFPYGIIKQNLNKKNAIVSPLYAVFSPSSETVGYILHCYFESKIRTKNYLKPIIQKGAKNTINISNNDFISKKIFLPKNDAYQKHVVSILKEFNEEINLIKKEINFLQEQKRGLMQLLLTGIVRVKVN